MKVLKYIVEKFKEVFGRQPDLIASAPGRLDFLNTHQDYKGLPVVSVAINKRTYIAVADSQSTTRVISLNLCLDGLPCMDEFSVEKPVLRGGGWFGDYIRSVVLTLKNKYRLAKDFYMLIYSEIPIASGLASSAALQVASIKALSDLWGFKLEKGEIAELAYISEHDVMGIPCGRLDQYGSAFGYVSRIETRPPYGVKTLETYTLKFVAINSGIRHSTGAIHPIRINEIRRGLEQLLLQKDIPSELKRLISLDPYETKWELINIETITPYLERLEYNAKRRILFTLKMHYSTIQALELMENPNPSRIREVEEYLTRECSVCLEEALKTHNPLLKALGGLINYQHVLLRDMYDVSTPELEEIRRRALEAGAIGVKISGAGLGGALFAIVEDEIIGERVARETSRTAAGAWLVKIDEGVRIEEI